MRLTGLILFVVTTSNMTFAQGAEKQLPSAEYKAVQITNGDETTLRRLLRKTGLDSAEVINSLRGDSVKYALLPISDLTQQQLTKLETDIGQAERSLSNRHTAVSEVPILSEGKTLSLTTDEFIIRFHDTVSLNTINRFFAKKQIQILRPSAYDKQEYLISFRNVTPGTRPEVMIERETTLVEYITPNFTSIKPKSSKQHRDPVAVENIPVGVPNDTLIKFQWHLFVISALRTSATDSSCCDMAKNGAEVIVAVLDEGVDTLHVDLKDKIVKQFDILHNKRLQQPGKDETHGTACAGIIAASTNNEIGISGIACQARIMPIRVWNPSMKSVFNAVEGIRYAIYNGARVINCSWELLTTSKQERRPVDRVIDEAIRNNCILVFAAGNSGADSVAYPGCLSSEKDIITVAATNKTGTIKMIDPTVKDDWGSQFGKGITLGAPGVEIYTTYNTINNKPTYDLFDGTSSATPIVSGAIALMLSVRPDLTPADVKAIIATSCDPPDAASKDPKLGNGRLNIRSLVQNAKDFKR